jgi:hypothetical protein
VFFVESEVPMFGMVVLLAVAQSATTVATDKAIAPAAAVAEPTSRTPDETWLSATEKRPNGPGQKWNWHVQNTDIVQGDPGFPAKYSGPASLNSKGEIQQTVTLDLFAGGRLWRGAEAHMDFLMWQGFGLSKTYGVEAFPDRKSVV